jgi:transposase
MLPKYRVTLTDDERAELLALTKKERLAARKLARIHILLAAHDGVDDETIVRTLHVSRATVHRTRERFVVGGVDWALEERPRPGAKRKLDGKQEALLIAIACTPPPEGRVRWTMQLLADEAVRVELVDTLSDETVRRTLKKKRPQALVARGMVSAAGERGIRVAHGGRS